MAEKYDPGMLAEKSGDTLPAPQFLHPNSQEAQYERRQCLDEGKDISSLNEEFSRLINADEVEKDELNALFDAARDLPQRDDYRYEEPSSLEEIRAMRPDGPRQLDQAGGSLEDLFDTIYGGWLGAVAGCFLGKPVQGWTREQIIGFLKASDQYPIDGYLHSDVSQEVVDGYDIYRTVESSSPEESMFVNDVPHMPVDDDIDYIVVGLGVANKHGPTYQPVDIADYWLQNIPAFNTYTAERIAYRNFMNLITPPESAEFRNPYREHVGAMIRADMWGYLALGDLERAAEYAWRDASVSHVKNGIYGEMWASAMIAAAPFESDPRNLLELGLTEIPADSRLAEAVDDVITWYDDGKEYEKAVENIHDRWDETDQFDWVHTISNVQVLAVGLLWGEGDFGRSLRLAVQAGFDTDSHGATLGSILGTAHGANALPEEWVDPLNDTVDTSLVTYQTQRISDLAAETVDAAQVFSE